MRKWKCISVNNGNKGAFTVGKTYETDDNMLNCEVDNGYILTNVKIVEKGDVERGLVFEEVFEKEEDVKMNKFKVGDRVRILDGTPQRDWNSEGSMKKYINTEGIIEGITNYTPKFEVKLDLDNDFWWFNEEDLKLVEDNSKTITITTSDTTTTLTDGTHTTSINRYYTDKHNERNAVSIVIDKYYDELAEIEKLSKLPKVGDKVRVVDHGKTHSTYDEWLIKNNVNLKSAIKWRNGLSPKNGGEYIIKEIHKHEYFDIDLALIEDADNAYIMNIKGLEVIK